MKLARLTASILLALSITACSSRMSNDHSFENIQDNYNKYQQITQQYHIDSMWWKGYQDTQLNHLIDTALAQNKDLAKSAILVNKALFNANLINANLVPNFSLQGQSTTQRGVVNPTKQPYSTGSSTINHSIGLNLTYTLDLWQRLANASDAAEWQAKATMQDLETARLSLIHAVINSYYQLTYLNEVIQITENTKHNYQRINQIIKNKYHTGLITRLELDQANVALLKAQEKLLDLQVSKKQAEQVLRDLLNLTPEQSFAVNFTKLLDMPLQNIDLNVPLSSIANRPDLKSALFRFQSSFNELKASENSWFPTITLGASLASTSGLVNDLGDNSIFGGLLSFNLPFLDWQRVKARINISEQDYQLAKINYEQKVTKALNEINTYHYSYQKAKEILKNQKNVYQHSQSISSIYKNRYAEGIVELSKWLDALTVANNSKLALIQAKYDVLKYEILIYQAMAGKYSTKAKYNENSTPKNSQSVKN